jgi:hypothetical protein
LTVPVIERLKLFAGTSSAGQQAFEVVLAERRGLRSYQLLASPGLVLGLAAGDLIEVEGDGQFRVTARGGNICIWIFANGNLDELERITADAFSQWNGRVDGRADREIVVTVPIEAGFANIEQTLRSLMETHPGAEWYYGNVYDPVDGVTPLNWWVRP